MKLKPWRYRLPYRNTFQTDDSIVQKASPRGGFLMALVDPSGTTAAVSLAVPISRIGGLLLQLTHRLNRKAPKTT